MEYIRTVTAKQLSTCQSVETKSFMHICLPINVQLGAGIMGAALLCLTYSIAGCFMRFDRCEIDNLSLFLRKTLPPRQHFMGLTLSKGIQTTESRYCQGSGAKLCHFLTLLANRCCCCATYLRRAGRYLARVTRPQPMHAQHRRALVTGLFQDRPSLTSQT